MSCLFLSIAFFSSSVLCMYLWYNTGPSQIPSSILNSFSVILGPISVSLENKELVSTGIYGTVVLTLYFIRFPHSLLFWYHMKFSSQDRIRIKLLAVGCSTFVRVPCEECHLDLGYFWKVPWNGINYQLVNCHRSGLHEMLSFRSAHSLLYKYALGETFHQDTHTGMVYLIYYTKQTPFWWNNNKNNNWFVQE